MICLGTIFATTFVGAEAVWKLTADAIYEAAWKEGYDQGWGDGHEKRLMSDMEDICI
jgi:hypothetical protein